MLPKTAFHLDSTRCEIKSRHIWEMVHGEVINSIRGCGGNSFLFSLLRNRTRVRNSDCNRADP